MPLWCCDSRVSLKRRQRTNRTTSSCTAPHWEKERSCCGCTAGSIFTHLPSSFTLAAPWADVHHAAGQSANGPAPPAPPLTTARLSRRTLVSCCDWRDARVFRRYSTQTSTKGKSSSKTLPVSHTAVETVSGQWFKTPSYPGNLFRWIKINGSLCLWMNLCLSISLFDDSVIVWTESLLLFCTFCNLSSCCCYLFWFLSSEFCVFVVVVSCVMLSSVWWWCCNYVYVSWNVLYQSFLRSPGRLAPTYVIAHRIQWTSKVIVCFYRLELTNVDK